MRIHFILTGFVLTLRALLRRRVTLIMLFLVPTLFYLIVDYTTGDVELFFELASVSEASFISTPARDVSLVFIGIASTGLLASFLAMSMVQQEVAVIRRLVLCGYRASEVLVAKLLVLIGFITAIGCYVAALLLAFVELSRPVEVMIGYILGGLVYGCYGLLVGALFRRELEGILFVVLLANIDAGWLQNPVFYTAAENTAFIENLPAYFPSQFSLTAAFTDEPIAGPLRGSVLYGGALLAAAMAVYALRMRNWPRWLRWPRKPSHVERAS